MRCSDCGEVEQACEVCHWVVCDCEARRECECRFAERAADERDEMDGDHASALASAGFGTDEDYGGQPEHDDWGDAYYGEDY